jgi:hypothetical protein
VSALTPAAATLLAHMADGWTVEANDPGGHDAREYRLVKRMPYYGDIASAAAELAEQGLVDTAANGSGNCWINTNGRAAALDLSK